MSIDEYIKLARGDKLVCIPSGLVVEALAVNSDGVEVLAPRGGKFTIKIDNLEVLNG